MFKFFKKRRNKDYTEAPVFESDAFFDDSLGVDVELDEKARLFTAEVSKYDRMLKADPAVSFVVQIGNAPEAVPRYYSGTNGDEIVTVTDEKSARHFRSAELLLLSYEVMKYKGMNPTIIIIRD